MQPHFLYPDFYINFCLTDIMQKTGLDCSKKFLRRILTKNWKKWLKLETKLHWQLPFYPNQQLQQNICLCLMMVRNSFKRIIFSEQKKIVRVHWIAKSICYYVSGRIVYISLMIVVEIYNVAVKLNWFFHPNEHPEGNFW